MDKEGFIALAKPGTIVPVYREVIADLVTPLTAFLRLDRDPAQAAFLLESVEGGEKWGRYSFIGVMPKAMVRTRNTEVQHWCNDEWKSAENEDPLKFICQTAEKFTPADCPELPRFWGGWVGYLGYDMVHFVETLPKQAERDVPVWDSYLIEPQIVVALDALRQRATIIHPVTIHDGLDLDQAFEEAEKLIAETARDLSTPVVQPRPRVDSEPMPEEPSPNLNEAQFCNAVEKAQEYIRSGDIIQVVLSRRFEIPTRRMAHFDLYRALRLTNPSPYLFYIRFPEYSVVGASPEILVRRESNTVEVRPIAGTRRRGANKQDDLAIEAELKADPKEVAEHVMLLDLGRNDIGRIAETGTVQITEQMVIERYSHVMHLVSSVKGTVTPDTPMEDVIRATFPAGTLSGAPKVRAMEIIEELEPNGRGVYGGAAGYLGYDGNLDMAIAIRSVLAFEDKLYVQAGAGIVYDSVPEREFEETREKARGVLRAIQMAREALGQ